MVYSRIFLFSCLCCFFQIANASYRWSVGIGQLQNKFFESADEACRAAAPFFGATYSYFKEEQMGSYAFYCAFSNGGRAGLNRDGSSACPVVGTSNGSASLRLNGEIFTAPTTLCIDKCSYEFKNVTIGQEVRKDGHITTVFVGSTSSQDQTCPTNTKNDDPPPLNPCRKKQNDGTYKDLDYCNLPPNERCAPGYVSGTFNGKVVCVKQDKNNKDNCKATVSEPYKCLPNQPQKPQNPDKDNNCSEGTIQVIIGSTLKCVTREVPPNPDGSCPKDYVRQTYDGVSVCVPNNQRPDDSNNCPLNTSITTLPDGSKVCRGGGGNDDGSGASEPTTGGEGTGGSGNCDPKKDFLCKDVDLPDSTKLQINDMNLPDINENKISWSQSCPADVSATFSGHTYKFEYAKACSFLSNYISPLMVAFGYLSGGFIIIGAARK